MVSLLWLVIIAGLILLIKIFVYSYRAWRRAEEAFEAAVTAALEARLAHERADIAMIADLPAQRTHLRLVREEDRYGLGG